VGGLVVSFSGHCTRANYKHGVERSRTTLSVVLPI
jgi:hypothetical protein